jgi:hypothetical protein
MTYLYSYNYNDHILIIMGTIPPVEILYYISVVDVTIWLFHVTGL